MKRFAGAIVAALTLAALAAAPASANVLDRYVLDIDESRSQVKVDGPGFKVKLTKDALTTQIDDARFGFPQPDRPIERPSQIGPGPGARAYVCENGTLSGDRGRPGDLRQAWSGCRATSRAPCRRIRTLSTPVSGIRSRSSAP